MSPQIRAKSILDIAILWDFIANLFVTINRPDKQCENALNVAHILQDTKLNINKLDLILSTGAW